MRQKILVCIDILEPCKNSVDYGIYFAKKLNLPLMFLYVVESNFTNTELACSFGIGSSGCVIEDLVEEQTQKNENLCKESKKILKELSLYAKDKGVAECFGVQRDGDLEEILKDYDGKMRLVIAGLKGNGEKQKIGKHMEELVRALNVPILLINSAFKEIKSVMMAYDGSQLAKKAITQAIQAPLFKDAKRYVVNVSNDEKNSWELLLQANKLFKDANLTIETKHLNGEICKALFDFQEQNNVDLLIMGAYSHHWLKSILFGSLTNEILTKSKKPLLLIR
ncbi:universal stress protein [Campylobacter insulaenigrae]|uniref:universal stress protein n=1 Tax=Campylobacter insulaenigrae TaxID=260714 RepID=UPI00215239BB|nr:universal stress protein [Campylobacter insulaenigrae]MCR6572677.1 universal stress protein [Campylobacter insulaenigrae]MCR6575402.1 universal stress protein [Campylobacter insulaenigrae]MCR6580905.1 universal stress protein [Campylobacter insulaenigrae]MCR6585040.1 universal stress protein [Campylobacter insulaenigrae]